MSHQILIIYLQVAKISNIKFQIDYFLPIIKINRSSKLFSFISRIFYEKTVIKQFLKKNKKVVYNKVFKKKKLLW